MDTQPSRAGDRDAPRRTSRRGLYTILAVLALLTVAAVFVREQFFTIRQVEICYVSDIPYQEVLTLAGLDAGVNYFGLSETAIRAGIDANRYLTFERMEKVWPDKVILYVTERRADANIVHMGWQYTISRDGMVLERSAQINLDNGCVLISGVSIRDIRVSAPISCQNAAQMEAMYALLDELDMQGYARQVAELNLSSLDNIYLVTMDGYTVNLGDTHDLRAKLGTVRAVVTELRARGLKGGMVEASVPGEATYRPIR